MPRPRSTTSKSEAIRQVLTRSPDKPAGEIAKQLGVTPGLVYNVKSSMQKGSGRGRKRGRRVTRATVIPPSGRRKRTAPEGAHAALDQAFDFVIKVGGLLNAEQLIAKLKAIREQL